jgi:hypothetical protein
LSATGIQKPNCIDIHENQFVQIQRHLWVTTLDLSAQIVELLISKITAKPDSSAASHRKAFNPQSHISGPASAHKKCKPEANQSYPGTKHLQSGRLMNFQDFLSNQDMKRHSGGAKRQTPRVLTPRLLPG